MTAIEQNRILGHYQLLHPLGRGGTGTVYLAEDQSLGREVALKILDQPLTARADFEKRFRQEARLVAGLHHPRIISIHALQHLEGHWVIDMPYIKRGSLADACQRDEFRLDQVLMTLCDVLHALGCCHDAGIVHRDVKPNNILIQEDGRALLSDFGLAKILDAQYTGAMQDMASSSFFIGTPRYAPPESWDGAQPTPAWDLYSIGAILYEAVSGEVPYPAKTPYLLVKQMVSHPPAPLAEVSREVSPQLCAIVDSMLAQEPDQRPQQAPEVIEALSETPEVKCASENTGSTIVRLPVHTSSSSFRSTTTRRFSLRGIAWPLVTAVLVAVSAFLFWMLRNMPASAPAVSRIGEISQAYDTFDPNSRTIWPSHFLVRPGDSPDQWRMLGAQGTHVWFINASENDDIVRLHGAWAEYTDPSARGFRHGTLRGTGNRLAKENGMMLSLDFRCDMDGDRWSQPLLLKSAAAPVSPAGYIHGLEANAHLHSLLYNEVFPRNLSWAGSLESEFLGLATPCIDVHFLNTALTPVTLDGRMEEAAWRIVRPATSTESAMADSSLLLHFDHNGLYGGVRVKTTATEPRLLLTVLNAFSIPVQHSTYWHVQAGSNGIETYEKRTEGTIAPWQSTWQTACTVASGSFQAEFFIPFDSLDSPPPKPGERWRLACVVMDRGQPVAHWGTADVSQPEHGALLVFGPYTMTGSEQ